MSALPAHTRRRAGCHGTWQQAKKLRRFGMMPSGRWTHFAIAAEARIVHWHVIPARQHRQHRVMWMDAQQVAHEYQHTMDVTAFLLSKLSCRLTPIH